MTTYDEERLGELLAGHAALGAQELDPVVHRLVELGPARHQAARSSQPMMQLGSASMRNSIAPPTVCTRTESTVSIEITGRVGTDVPASLAWGRIRESHRSAAQIIDRSAQRLRELGDESGAALCTQLVADLDRLALHAGQKAIGK